MLYYHIWFLLNLFSNNGDYKFNVDGKQVDTNVMIIVIVKCFDYSWKNGSEGRSPPTARLESQEERKRSESRRRSKDRKLWNDRRRPERLEAVARPGKIGRPEAVARLVRVGRSEAAERLEKIGRLEAVARLSRTDCEPIGRPTRLKIERVEENGQRPDGTGRVTRTGFCHKKRSYHKGDSRGIRGSLR
jgi:hypothetical protein